MIMVTGGAGFIGSHICRYLVDKDQDVLIYDNLNEEQLSIVKKIRLADTWNKLKVLNGDICDFPQLLQTIKENEIEKIVHTAAITFIPTAIKNPSLTFRINVEGAFNILEAARINDVKKVVYISTASIYGDFQKTLVDETHPLEAKDIYGATKLAADRLSMSYNRTYGLDVAVVRTTSVYGPGDLENRAAKIFVENALTGKEICLEGGGLQRRDFSYVKDVARGICLVLMSDKTKGEIVHISGGNDNSIKELAEIIAKYIPGVKMVVAPSRKVDVNRGKLDISKAEKLIGYKPEFSLDKGIRDYVKWFVNVYAPFFDLKIVNNPVIK